MHSQLHAESVARLVDPLAMRPGMRLVIDFSDVQYLASSALGELIRLKKQLGVGGHRLGLQHVHPDLVEVCRITRLDEVFDLEP